MVNILLVCTAGISTSELVKEMRKSAEFKGIDTGIWTVGDADSAEAAKKADIVLLGPQVRHLQEKMRERVNNQIPVSVIDMRTYGSMDGEKALDSALKTLEEFKENNK